MQQQEYTWSTDSKGSTIKQHLTEQSTRCELFATKTSGGSAFVH